ncbi:MAG: hypothetical protein KDB03_24155 [Planctomycetales bacterium]|nr:hypothetical protein [Planctomycetales bacterium]
MTKLKVQSAARHMAFLGSVFLSCLFVSQLHAQKVLTASEFDFVLGNWNVRSTEQGDVIARNEFTRHSQNGAIVEKYQRGTTYQGIGLHYYDREQANWRQTWTGSDGGSGEFIGGLNGTLMRYVGTMRNADGKPQDVRGSFEPIDQDHFVQLGEISHDGGQSWETRYQLFYERATGQQDSAARSAITLVLEIDRVLAHQRDRMSETVPLASAVEAYLVGLNAIDYSACPPAFVEAFAAHRKAWEQSIEFFKQHAVLRGEMHQLFDQIRQQSEEQKSQLDLHVTSIMDTWKRVEATSNAIQ